MEDNVDARHYRSFYADRGIARRASSRYAPASFRRYDIS